MRPLSNKTFSCVAASVKRKNSNTETNNETPKTSQL